MGKIERFGATPEDWAHFDLVLGLTADLLPVVSNPNAKISGLSSLKALGKSPSLYNRSGEAVGLPRWTSRITTAKEIAEWAKQPDYGICIQTRNVRAIDIDVDDPRKAAAIVDRLQESAGQQLPRRWRENSGKCLLVAVVPGVIQKRSIKVDGGQVEFLGTGQQFVAIGTHPSGVRYQWS